MWNLPELRPHLSQYSPLVTLSSHSRHNPWINSCILSLVKMQTTPIKCTLLCMEVDIAYKSLGVSPRLMLLQDRMQLSEALGQNWKLARRHSPPDCLGAATTTVPQCPLLAMPKLQKITHLATPAILSCNNASKITHFGHLCASSSLW
jgi:hypothetical protein